MLEEVAKAILALKDAIEKEIPDAIRATVKMEMKYRDVELSVEKSPFTSINIKQWGYDMWHQNRGKTNQAIPTRQPTKRRRT